MLHRVYIDEAGDRGRATGSSDHFVVSAAVIPDENDVLVREELDAAKAAIGLPAQNVVHFRKLPHSKKVRVCQDVSNFSVGCLTNVVVCKKQLEPYPSGALPYITNPDPLYLWAVRLLLERVSWYVRDHGGGTSIVTFAHLTRFKAEKLHNYRGALENSETSIHWESFAGHPFRINYPEKIQLLQVADCSASALYKAVEKDQFGVTEPRYLTELSPAIYRYGGNSKITSYGLKVFPTNMVSSGQPLHFLQSV